MSIVVVAAEGQGPETITLQHLLSQPAGNVSQELLQELQRVFTSQQSGSQENNGGVQQRTFHDPPTDGVQGTQGIRDQPPLPPHHGVSQQPQSHDQSRSPPPQHQQQQPIRPGVEPPQQQNDGQFDFSFQQPGRDPSKHLQKREVQDGQNNGTDRDSDDGQDSYVSDISDYTDESDYSDENDYSDDSDDSATQVYGADQQFNSSTADNSPVHENKDG